MVLVKEVEIPQWFGVFNRVFCFNAMKPRRLQLNTVIQMERIAFDGS
jgi:hypothetical protein